MTPPRPAITVICIALSFFLSFFICLAIGNSPDRALLGACGSAVLTCFGMLLLIRSPWRRH